VVLYVPLKAFAGAVVQKVLEAPALNQKWISDVPVTEHHCDSIPRHRIKDSECGSDSSQDLIEPSSVAQRGVQSWVQDCLTSLEVVL
jgi:hypothetical protein